MRFGFLILAAAPSEQWMTVEEFAESLTHEVLRDAKRAIGLRAPGDKGLRLLSRPLRSVVGIAGVPLVDSFFTHKAVLRSRDQLTVCIPDPMHQQQHTALTVCSARLTGRLEVVSDAEINNRFVEKWHEIFEPMLMLANFDSRAKTVKNLRAGITDGWARCAAGYFARTDPHRCLDLEEVLKKRRYIEDVRLQLYGVMGEEPTPWRWKDETAIGDRWSAWRSACCHLFEEPDSEFCPSCPTSRALERKGPPLGTSEPPPLVLETI